MQPVASSQDDDSEVARGQQRFSVPAKTLRGRGRIAVAGVAARDRAARCSLRAAVERRAAKVACRSPRRKAVRSSLPPRSGRKSRVLDRRRPDHVERRAERHRPDAGDDVRPGRRRRMQAVIYRRFTRRLEEPARAGRLRPRRADHPGAGRRHDPRPLQELRPEQPALDALPRRALRDRLRRRVHPGRLRAGRRREAGADLHLQARGRRRLGRRLAVLRPLAVDGRVDPRRPVRRALDPRRRASASPTASSSSSSGSSSTSTRSTASRSSTTRRRSAPRSATSCSGTCSASATTTTASTSTGTAGRPPTARATCRRVSPAESFVVPLEGRQAGHVALPLPRGGAHDERDDRALRRHEVAWRADRLRGARRYSAAHGCPGPTDARRAQAPRRLPDLRADVPRQAARVSSNSAASSQKPRQVLDAMTEFYETSYANVHRGVYELGERATAGLEGAREKARAFVNAPTAREIIFVRNATEALNLVAYAWGLAQLGPGDVVLATRARAPLELRAVAVRREPHGRRLPDHPDRRHGRARSSTSSTDLENVKVVAANVVSNSLGTINDTKRLAAWAHERGAILVCDAAQAAPHVRLDVQSARRRLRRRLRPQDVRPERHRLPLGPRRAAARDGAVPARRPHDPQRRRRARRRWGELPAKFEAGTSPMAEAVGLGAAIDYLEAVGLEAIEAHEHALAAYALERARRDPRHHALRPAARAARRASSVQRRGRPPARRGAVPRPRRRSRSAPATTAASR